MVRALGFAAVSTALCAAAAGCGASRSRQDPRPDDAGSDPEVDAGTDGGPDASCEGPEPLVPDARARQVCGLAELREGSPGALRVLAFACGEAGPCAVEATAAGFDLLPPFAIDGCAEARPVWVECAVPDVAGPVTEISVRGESLGEHCTCADCDCERWDCFQLPDEPTPPGCLRDALRPDVACVRELVPAHGDGRVTVAETCRCSADFRPAGCLARETDGVVVFEPQIARCTECGPNALCVVAEGACSLYDRDPGPFEVAIDRWNAAGEAVLGGCEGALLCR